MRNALNLLFVSACAAPACALSLEQFERSIGWVDPHPYLRDRSRGIDRNDPRYCYEELLRDTKRTVARRHHVRITYGSLPKNGDFAVSIEGIDSATTDAEWDKAERMTASYAYHGQVDRMVGYGLGVGFINDRWSSSLPDVESSLSVHGLQAEPQLIIRTAPWFAVELGLPLGAGVATWKSDDGILSYNLDGLSTWYGLVARPVLLIGDLELFVEGGWLSSHTKTSGTAFLFDVEVDNAISGGYASVGIGAAF